MPETIVYILGAGFSAPLGLPVMRDFISKSKDLHREDPSTYASFAEIFKIIDGLSRAKSRYAVDLENIEEILSILDMESGIGGRRRYEEFTGFIKQVVAACTPELGGIGFEAVMLNRQMPHEWTSRLFGSDEVFGAYGGFVASLVGLRLQRRVMQTDDGADASKKDTVPFTLERSFVDDGRPDYYVLTLNYDLVLETFLEYIDSIFEPEAGAQSSARQRLQVAKLHGSVDGDIMPPTWNKTTDWPRMHGVWRTAYEWLANADRIRILGYSLPETDSYVKYLLKSAVLQSDYLRLKTIDVIDTSEATIKRYQDFVDPSHLRVVRSDVTSYLERLVEPAPDIDFEAQKLERLCFRRLEEVHEEFMGGGDEE